MRGKVWPLLLLFTSTLSAQTGTAPRSLVPPVAVAPSRPAKPGDIVSTRELLLPSKAQKELQRSQTAFLSGDVRSSAQHLEKALRIYPDYLEARNNLGSRYFTLGEYDRAAAEFQKAINIDPRVAEPFNNLSVAFFLLQRYPDAEIAARRALALDPRNSTSRYMLGCVLATENRSPLEAMEMLRQTKEEFPDARLLLAQVLIRQGAVGEAENELRDYLKLPGVEKKQRIECWLARLEQTLLPGGCAQASTH